MKLFTIILFFGICSLGFSQNTIKKVQVKQKQRIHQGIKSGELTKREAKNLIQGQKKINRMKKNAKKDGVVTKKEKARIRNAQKRQSKKIYKQKHDRKKRH